MAHPAPYLHMSPFAPDYNQTYMKIHISVLFRIPKNIHINDLGQEQVSMENLH